MTEAEWNRCADPEKMLEWLRRSGNGTARKLRLFAAACCRWIAGFVAGDAAWRAIETVESFADGDAPLSALESAEREMDEIFIEFQGREETAASAVHCACETDLSNLPSMVREVALLARGIWQHIPRRSASLLARRRMCHLLRDVFNNPFRLVAFDSAWQTPVVLSVAQRAYAESGLPDRRLDNALLSILADALEETGCDNAAILVHLRSPGPHIRGCWPLDLLLNKS